MKTVIRKIRQSDYAAVAVIWREVLDIRNATVEHVTETYEAMRQDAHYVTFVAEADEKSLDWSPLSKCWQLAIRAVMSK